MIVRIMAEGQYELDSESFERLHALDDSLLDAVHRNNENEFLQYFGQAIALVRQGKPLQTTKAAESDLILPPADTSLDEARSMLTGDWFQ